MLVRCWAARWFGGLGRRDCGTGGGAWHREAGARIDISEGGEDRETHTQKVRKASETLAADLEAFAVHGKRKTIASADVLLAARRNPSLLLKLRKTAADHAAISASKSKKRKTKDGTAAAGAAVAAAATDMAEGDVDAE